MSSAYFISEYRKTHGHPPTGQYRHFCPDWDGMPIDDTCKEFEACLCFHETLPSLELEEGNSFAAAIGLILFSIGAILLVVLTH